MNNYGGDDHDGGVDRMLTYYERFTVSGSWKYIHDVYNRVLEVYIRYNRMP